MDCDVAVLGGGPGGYTAAIRAAQLGAKSVCIEKETELGGTCLRVGCIPTKAWVQTAHFLHQGNETFAKLGVKVDGATLDFGAANEWKAGVVKQMTQGVAGLLKANGVDWVKGAGKFKDANTIAVEGGDDVSFKSAIIATGSFPLRPRSREEKADVIRRLREDVLPLLANGRVVVPVHATFPLDRAQEAYDAFAAGGKFGKIVILP